MYYDQGPLPSGDRPRPTGAMGGSLYTPPPRPPRPQPTYGGMNYGGREQQAMYQSRKLPLRKLPGAPGGMNIGYYQGQMQQQQQPPQMPVYGQPRWLSSSIGGGGGGDYQMPWMQNRYRPPNNVLNGQEQQWPQYDPSNRPRLY